MTLPVIPDLALVNGLPPITCAKYGVQIVDKRNGATVARLPEVGWGLTYDYRIDRTSEAQLTVDVGPGGVGEECCAQLGRVGHWMHELSVYREGNNREVWGGPIVKLRDSPGRGQFTIQAKDRSAWWWRRALAYSLMYSGNTKADATRVFMDLLKAAEQATGSSAWKLPYDPVRLNVSGRETGVIVDGKILTASDIVMIGPEIQTLADSVIDWTVIGRTCYVGALVIELDPLPILAQEHWLELDPEIEWDGESVATQVVVMGARGIMGIWPPGPVTVPRWPQYGSHTLRISDPKLTDQATATERARTMWELHQQPALCVLSAGGSLGPNAPVVPQDLVPGRVTNVGFDTSCFITGTRLAQTRANGALQYVAYDSGIARDLVVAQRITKTTVRVEDSQEVSVLVDLQPPGTADVRRPGGRSARQPVIPEPSTSFCLVLESGDAFSDPAEIFTGGPGYSCSEAGYYGLGFTFDDGPWPIAWDFTLTAAEAAQLNALGYLMLRAEILYPTGAPAADSGQVVFQLNGEPSVTLVGVLPGVSTGAPASGGFPPSGPMVSGPTVISTTGFVAGLNTVTVTLVDLFNGPDQTIELVRVDEMGLGQLDVALFEDGVCLTCTEPEVPVCDFITSDEGTSVGSGTAPTLYSTNPGFCSPTGYWRLGATGNEISWTVNLTAGQVTDQNALNGIWCRGVIEEAVGGYTGLGADYQVRVSVNGSYLGCADSFARVPFGTDPPIAVGDEFAVLLNLGPDWVVGDNDLRITLVDTNNGPKTIQHLVIDEFALGAHTVDFHSDTDTGCFECGPAPFEG
jgi:hypothetical protein